ncbi:hypothetical protein IFM89_013537 [Coptis chinensis]|uniref:t-SNARE coiled-coil homology domain-containing protein n=1 Tax=Coptis chinensis TaxID=261450 RepID=A0A835H462_9MAGN|nr:hypothetical protein IFM89_013537 [Coptis chinensis]
MFQDAVQEQGLIAKTTLMQQRSDGLKDLEKRMSELHEVFSDMAVLIKVQGKHIYDVENQVEKAISGGTQPLANAKPHKRCTRTRILIVVIIIILISVILIIERKRVLKFLNPGHSY